ncbi:MAG: TIGR01212 family radical SAM protein [Cytophagales bacterium]|nr:TIGR01212 family radical SAM protein [Cytophagales bacterium]
MQSQEQIQYPWGSELPYYSYAHYLKTKYGGRVQKVSINAGFTCPNRDGKVAKGGCTFCNNKSFTPSYTRNGETIGEQVDRGISFLAKRYKRTKKFVGYFQAYTNTYAPLSELTALYEEALKHPRLDGIVISTRPDCVSDELLDYLQDLSSRKIVVLELGIESCYNDTLERINRGHDFETTVDAIHRAAGRGFHVGGHLLFGLPGDSREKMLEQAEIISGLPLDSIKFHQLQIVKGTVMAQQYREDASQFNLFSKDEYIDFVIEFMARLRPDICVQRFISEAPLDLRLAPNWGNFRSDVVMKEIEDKMKRQGVRQGMNF